MAPVDEVPATSDDVAGMLVAAVAELGLDLEQVDTDQWMTVLAGEWKRTIPVLFDLGTRSLRVTSLLAGAPDEQADQVHELLLHRNERAGWVHFALTDTDDIVLTGRVLRSAVTPAVIDELLGEVLALSDETFNSVLRTGFATYIEAEQRWRRGNDLPPNPVSEAG